MVSYVCVCVYILIIQDLIWVFCYWYIITFTYPLVRSPHVLSQQGCCKSNDELMSVLHSWSERFTTFPRLHHTIKRTHTVTTPPTDLCCTTHGTTQDMIDVIDLIQRAQQSKEVRNRFLLGQEKFGTAGQTGVLANRPPHLPWRLCRFQWGEHGGW